MVVESDHIPSDKPLYLRKWFVGASVGEDWGWVYQIVMPRMEDCVGRIGTVSFITTLDLLKGYWQLPLTPRASEVSAFVTPNNFMLYWVMPFGLKNAPATFQCLMQRVLGDVSHCSVYLDDDVIYLGDWSSHVYSCGQCSSSLRRHV